MKEAIDNAARRSGMSASAYVELLFISKFGKELPRLVLTAISPTGERKEVPMGAYSKKRQWLAETGEDVLRPSYTFSFEFSDQLDAAAEASGLTFSSYFRRVLEVAWPDHSFPVIGTELFQIDDDSLSPRLEFSMA